MTVQSSNAPLGAAARGARMKASRIAGDVEILSSGDQLAIWSEEWRRLAADPLEPSICAAPDWLAPMFENPGPDTGKACIICVPTVPKGPLAAFMPLKLQANRWLAPLTCLSSWNNDFFFAGTPLVSRANPQQAIASVLVAAREHLAARAILFRMVTGDGAFACHLETAAASIDCPSMRLEPFERACLVTGRDWDSWYAENFKTKKRKEFRRLHNRLGEQGELRTLSLQQEGDPTAWVGEFLALEQAGWKGRRGTALACANHMTAFFNSALPRLHRSGDLMFWKLALDDRPLAMLFAMVSGPRAWLGKIAFDEEFARYSPGVLLVLEATKDLLTRPGITCVDSSAIPDHPMINRIWRDRLAMCDLLVATPGTSRTAFRLIAAAEKTKRAARHRAKAAYHRFLKGPMK